MYIRELKYGPFYLFGNVPFVMLAVPGYLKIYVCNSLKLFVSGPVIKNHCPDK